MQEDFKALLFKRDLLGNCRHMETVDEHET